MQTLKEVRANQAAAHRRQYAADPEVRKQSLIRSNDWRKENRGHVREMERARHATRALKDPAGTRAHNTEKHREYTKRRLARDPGYRKQLSRQSYAGVVKRKYGITSKDIDRMLIEQLGLCLICENPTKKFHVDHCHKTGKVRGLLCGGCNIGLGSFRDDVPRLKRAAAYLEGHQSV